MATLDHSLPLQVKAPDMMGMLDQGSQLAQFYTQQKSDGELNRLYKETNGDLDKMMEIGKTSPMARFVMPQLQAQKSAQQKSALDQQKIEADIGKTKSEAFKNNQQGGGFNLDNTAKLMGQANQALYVATRSGDLNAVKLALNNAKSAGLFNSNPEAYDRYLATAESLSKNPDGLKTFALDLQMAYAQNPEKLNFADANTVLDNETSITNNKLTNQTSADNNIRTNQTSENNSIRSAETSRYSTDVGAQTAANKLSFEEAKNEQEQKKGTVLQWGDTMYMVYPDNRVVPITSPTGQKIIASKPESKIEKVERVEKTQNFAIASRTAADGATLAATLANDLKGLDSAAGGFGLQARVPGSAAHSFASKLETLKSGVFLAQIGNMKGMGALTDAEGARLEKSIASLDLSLSPQDLQANLTQIAQTLSRAAKNANSKTHLYGGQGQPTSQSQAIPASLANPFSEGKPLSGAQNQGFQSLVEKHTR